MMVSCSRRVSGVRKDGCGGMLRERFVRAAVALERIWCLRAVLVLVKQRRAAGLRKEAATASILFV